MIPVKYQKVYTDATTYYMLAVYEDGSTQIVDEQNMYCAEWLAIGNIPEIIAGNKYISFSENKEIIYDTISFIKDKNENLLKQIKLKRDNLLQESDFVLLRHSEQTDLVTLGKLSSTTLTSEQIVLVKVYRQSLRDITLQTDLNNIVWPTKPQVVNEKGTKDLF